MFSNAEISEISDTLPQVFARTNSFTEKNACFMENTDPICANA